MDNRIIFENWRQFINERNFFGADIDTNIKGKLASLRKMKNVGVFIKTNTQGASEGTVLISYVTFDTEDKKFKLNSPLPDKFPNMMSGLNPATTNVVADTEDPWGAVALEKAPTALGNCSDGWVIVRTEAKKGWGPLLYDIAIEYATKNGAGLMPDRKKVSSAALKVWYTYLTKRKEDIQSSQLDRKPPFDTVTPNDPNDDCDQTSAIKHGKEKWQDSPLSKIYSKPDDAVMQTLRIDNLIRIK